MSEHNVLITTTAINESIRLEHYKGIVSARVVTGVDFFSDLLASYSDVFGGRSRTYQKQLKSIYDEVMSHLTKEAIKLGANAIVGASIDHDEVSGKGKQMFMVTAIGTAAFIPDYGQVKQIAASDVKEEVSFENYQYEHKRLNMIFQVNQNIHAIPSYWQTILEFYSSEVMGQVFKLYDLIDIDYNNTVANVIQYFSGVEELN